MSRSNDWVVGSYHVCIRIYGDPKRVNLFHAAMCAVEGDWPWKPVGRKNDFTSHKYGSMTVCTQCLGIVLASPRISPHDIKACGLQFGVKVKVDRMAESSHCYLEGKTYSDTCRISFAEGHELYRHKTKRMRIENGAVLIGSETFAEHLQAVQAQRDGTAPPVQPQQPLLPISETVQ